MVESRAEGQAQETPASPGETQRLCSWSPESTVVFQCPHGYGGPWGHSQLPPGPVQAACRGTCLCPPDLTHQSLCDPSPPSTLQFRKTVPRPLRLVLQRFWEGVCAETEIPDRERERLAFPSVSGWKPRDRGSCLLSEWPRSDTRCFPCVSSFKPAQAMRVGFPFCAHDSHFASKEIMT